MTKIANMYRVDKLRKNASTKDNKIMGGLDPDLILVS